MRVRWDPGRREGSCDHSTLPYYMSVVCTVVPTVRRMYATLRFQIYHLTPDSDPALTARLPPTGVALYCVVSLPLVIYASKGDIMVSVLDLTHDLVSALSGIATEEDMAREK